MVNKTKPKVELIIPADVCGCNYSKWINNVWNVILDYREYLDVKSVPSDSNRAKELNAGGKTIVLNEEIIPLIIFKKRIKIVLDNYLISK